MDLPVIDISAWVGAARTAPGSELESARALAAEQLDRACRGTGAFLVTKAVHELTRSGGSRALVTMCCGGGLGTGKIIEAV